MTRARSRILLLGIILLVWIGANVVFYRMAGMPGLGLRYLALPALVGVVLFYLGAKFVKDAYRLDSLKEALKYLVACLFEIDVPVLWIADGKARLAEDGRNLLLKIGGPGRVVIQAGNVALAEDYRGAIRVLGAGAHRLNRYETLKEYTSLDERFRPIDELTARTKDGIKVAVQDVRYRYRIAGQAHAQGNRRPQDMLFQYSEAAVIQMVYNRTVSQNGIESWEEAVNRIVEGTITDYICRHNLDDLTTPASDQTDTRAEIYAEFFSTSGKEKFLARGAELEWIDIGHFDTPEKTVTGQRVSAWQERLRAAAGVKGVFSKQQRAFSEELGRAEAQADIFKQIINSAEVLTGSEEALPVKRSLFLARVAQVLDELAGNSADHFA